MPNGFTDLPPCSVGFLFYDKRIEWSFTWFPLDHECLKRARILKLFDVECELLLVVSLDYPENLQRRGGFAIPDHIVNAETHRGAGWQGLRQ